MLLLTLHLNLTMKITTERVEGLLTRLIVLLEGIQQQSVGWQMNSLELNQHPHDPLNWHSLFQIDRSMGFGLSSLCVFAQL